MKIQSIGNEAYAKNNLQKKNHYVQKQPVFGRAWEEHVSWGAKYIKENGKTNFKLPSFSDAIAVLLEVTKNPKLKLTNWWDHTVKVEKPEALAAATTAAAIAAISPLDNQSKIFPMENKGEGIYEVKDVDVQPGDGYRYIVVQKDGTLNTVKDPYAKKQENIHGWSTVYDENKYVWKNTEWLEGKDPRRIKRDPSKPLRGLENLIINEVNIPTLTLEGTFESAKSKIDMIAKQKNATAIEIMPVENTFSKQWGYDGVDKFAVNEKLGGPDGLKDLVDYAHGKGLNVIIDMVPNHVGPEGNYLSQTGPYKKRPAQFGDIPNYEGQDSKYVRDWMVNAALWWANEFKVDGIRFDLTKDTESDWLLREIVLELNHHNPDVFLIAEDHSFKRHSITNYWINSKIKHEDNINMIDDAIDKNNKGFEPAIPLSIGFDSEWDSQYKDAVAKMAINPCSTMLDDLDKYLPTSHYRVHYAYSHDEIGNWDGTRFIPKYMVAHLNLFTKVNGIDDQEKGQRAAQAAQKLSEIIVSENFENINERTLHQKELDLGINTFIPKQELIDVFKTAVAKQRLILGTIYTTPGPKMFFQGDDEGDLSHFKFFREFAGEKEKRAENPSIEQDAIRKYGYDYLEEIARPDSVVGRVKMGGMFKNLQTQMRAYTTDLRNVLDKNPVIKTGDIVGTYKDNNHNVHIHHIKSGDDEVLVIKNFGHGFHNNSYSYYGFPGNDTKWTEVFSSDDEKYGGMGYTNSGRMDISNDNQHLSLAPNSMIILKKIA